VAGSSILEASEVYIDCLKATENKTYKENGKFAHCYFSATAVLQVQEL